MSEADKPRIGLISVAVIGTCVALAVLVFGVIQVFDFAVDAEITRKVRQAESSTLRALRAEEQEKLTGYQWVDQSNGVLRIPIDRAKELTLRDWDKRPPPVVEPATAPADGGVAPDQGQ